MSASLASDLTCRIKLWGRGETHENELEETDYEYRVIREMWAEIVPVRAQERTTEGEESYAEYTHRITVRAPCALTTDMYITYAGKRFNVLHWDPHYKRRDRIVITAKEEVGRRAVYP